MDIFNCDDDRTAYLHFIAAQTSRFGVEVLAWCLMTNHVHFVAVPEEESSLARAFGEAHRLYTRMKNFEQGVRGYLFQGRFGSCVLDERHLIAAVRYVEQNPVRAKMVKEPWDYVWSSARFHVELEETDPLVKDRSLIGLVKDWRCLLLHPDMAAYENLRCGVRVGRPMGDEFFIKTVEAVVGRDLSKGKSGRPRKGE